MAGNLKNLLPVTDPSAVIPTSPQSRCYFVRAWHRSADTAERGRFHDAVAYFFLLSFQIPVCQFSYLEHRKSGGYFTDNCIGRNVRSG